MIICDRCGETIDRDTRVVVPTRQDVYGDETDWCTLCAEGLNDRLNAVRKMCSVQLKNRIEAVLREWAH